MDYLIEEVTLHRTPTGFLCFAHQYPVYAVGTTLQACLESLYSDLKVLLTSRQRTISRVVSSTADARLFITNASREPQFTIQIFDHGWERRARQEGRQQKLSKASQKISASVDTRF